jgi:hypothetical protein
MNYYIAYYTGAELPQPVVEPKPVTQDDVDEVEEAIKRRLQEKARIKAHQLELTKEKEHVPVSELQKGEDAQDEQEAEQQGEGQA